MNDVTLLTTDIINNYRTITNAPLSLSDYLSLRKQAALELQQGFLLIKDQYKSNENILAKEPQRIQETTVISKETQRPNKPTINRQIQDNEDDDDDDEDDEDSNEELLESNVENNFLSIINKIED